MAIIFEKFDSRETTVGPDSPSVDLLFGVGGTEDDLEVRALVESTIPAFYGGLILQNYRIQHLGGGVWDVTARYGRQESKDVGQSSFSFETSGGTTKITQSIQTVHKYQIPGTGGAPDYKGAIGVNGDSVEGVEITLPVYNFSETHYLPDNVVTMAYKANLFFLTGRVNAAMFRGFPRGDVLFLGVSGSKRGLEAWEISFKFAASPNSPGVIQARVGGIDEVIQKEGWQYLWVVYEDVKDEEAKMLVKRPKFAYVEQVYEYGDFSLLGIGV